MLLWIVRSRLEGVAQLANLIFVEWCSIQIEVCSRRGRCPPSFPTWVIRRRSPSFLEALSCMILILRWLIALVISFFGQHIRKITPRQRRFFLNKFKLVLLSSRIMLYATFCASKYFFAMYPCIQLGMLACQIRYIWINFAICSGSLSLTRLFFAADIWKLTIVTSLHF